MRVALLALGSRGDVLPYLALSEGLRAAGHELAVATFENFAPDVRSRGFAYHPIRGDIRALLRTAYGMQISQAGRSLIRLTRGILSSFLPLADDIGRGLHPLVDWAPDLILNQLPGGIYGHTLAERTGAAQILVSVIPLVPTRTAPMLAFPSRPAGIPGYNLLTHKLAYQMAWQPRRPAVNRWREALGLAPAPVRGCFDRTRGRLPVLQGISPRVVPRAPDWGPEIALTGYWFPEAAAWTPPPELSRFIESGPAPVFIGFGSMPLPDPGRTNALLMEALAKSGRRAVLAVDKERAEGMALSADVFSLKDFVPYDWLFRRMAAVVHHGGSGTTAFGLRAGVPGLVVPFTFDQFYWGRRLLQLGVGLRPIPFKSLTAGRLAGALLELTAASGPKDRAHSLGKGIRGERGVSRAVEIIEGM